MAEDPYCLRGTCHPLCIKATFITIEVRAYILPPERVAISRMSLGLDI